MQLNSNIRRKVLFLSEISVLLDNQQYEYD